MGDLQTLLADPEFTKLTDPALKRKLVEQVDPDIHGLDDAHYQALITKAVVPSMPAGPVPGMEKLGGKPPGPAKPPKPDESWGSRYAGRVWDQGGGPLVQSAKIVGEVLHPRPGSWGRIKEAAAPIIQGIRDEPGRIAGQAKAAWKGPTKEELADPRHRNTPGSIRTGHVMQMTPMLGGMLPGFQEQVNRGNTPEALADLTVMSSPLWGGKAGELGQDVINRRGGGGGGGGGNGGGGGRPPSGPPSGKLSLGERLTNKGTLNALQDFIPYWGDSGTGYKKKIINLGKAVVNATREEPSAYDLAKSYMKASEPTLPSQLTPPPEVPEGTARGGFGDTRIPRQDVTPVTTYTGPLDTKKVGGFGDTRVPRQNVEPVTTLLPEEPVPVEPQPPAPAPEPSPGPDALRRVRTGGFQGSLYPPRTPIVPMELTPPPEPSALGTTPRVVPELASLPEEGVSFPSGRSAANAKEPTSLAAAQAKIAAGQELTPADLAVIQEAAAARTAAEGKAGAATAEPAAAPAVTPAPAAAPPAAPAAAPLAGPAAAIAQDLVERGVPPEEAAAKAQEIVATRMEGTAPAAETPAAEPVVQATTPPPGLGPAPGGIAPAPASAELGPLDQGLSPGDVGEGRRFSTAKAAHGDVTSQINIALREGDFPGLPRGVRPKTGFLSGLATEIFGRPWPELTYEEKVALNEAVHGNPNQLPTRESMGLAPKTPAETAAPAVNLKNPPAAEKPPASDAIAPEVMDRLASDEAETRAKQEAAAKPAEPDMADKLNISANIHFKSDFDKLSTKNQGKLVNFMVEHGEPPTLEDAQAGRFIMGVQAAAKPKAAPRAPLAPTLKTPPADEFGPTKVVDENGKPLTVYHGTTHDVQEFKHGVNKTDEGYLGKGFYFGDAGTANVYAGTPSVNKFGESFKPQLPGGNVMPVQLKMQNPLEVTAEFVDSKRKGAPAVEIDRNLTVKKALGLPADASPQDITDAARKLGHDGIIYDYKGSKEYAVFDAGNIRSAIGRGSTKPRSAPAAPNLKSPPVAEKVTPEVVKETKPAAPTAAEEPLPLDKFAQTHYNVENWVDLDPAFQKAGKNYKAKHGELPTREDAEAGRFTEGRIRPKK